MIRLYIRRGRTQKSPQARDMYIFLIRASRENNFSILFLKKNKKLKRKKNQVNNNLHWFQPVIINFSIPSRYYTTTNYNFLFNLLLFKYPFEIHKATNGKPIHVSHIYLFLPFPNFNSVEQPSIRVNIFLQKNNKNKNKK